MGLMDNLKIASIEHPMKTAFYEDRANYLQTVAFFLALGERIDNKEEVAFVKLIDILDFNDYKEDLLEFLHSPNVKEFNESVESVGNNNLAIYYLCDIAYMLPKNSLSKDENDFLDLIAKKFDMNRNDIDLIHNYFRNIAEKDDSKIKENIDNILENEKLRKVIDEFSHNYGIDTIKDLSRAENSIIDGTEAAEKIKYGDIKTRDDYEIVLKAVRQDGRLLRYASMRLKDDYKIATEAISQNAWAFKYVSKRLKDDDNLVQKVYKQNKFFIYFTSDRLKNKYNFKKMKDDTDIVLNAVRESGWALGLASNRLKDDHAIVLEAVKQVVCALQFASDRLKDDDEIVQEVYKQNKLFVGWVSDKLKNKYHFHKMQDDYKIVLEAVKQDGRALLFASERLKDDNEIVREAIRQDGRAFLYASDRLKDDNDIAGEAVSQFGYVLQFASDRLKGDNQIVFEAISQEGWLLQYANKRLKDDYKIVKESVKMEGRVLQFASDRLKGDNQIVFEAISQDGRQLQFVSDRLKDNNKIVIEAVKQDGRALLFASERLKDDDTIVMEAIKQNAEVLKFASARLKISFMMKSSLNATGKPGMTMDNINYNLLYNKMKELYKKTDSNSLFFCLDKDTIGSERFQSKFINARSSFAENIRADETCLFLIDDTLFGSSTDGLIITTRAIYYGYLSKNENVIFNKTTKANLIKNNDLLVDGTKIGMVMLREYTKVIVEIINKVCEIKFGS